MEGNLTSTLGTDAIWGTNSNNTYFRNWARGTTEVCIPIGAAYDSNGSPILDYNGQEWVPRGAVNCSPLGFYGDGTSRGWYLFSGAIAIEIDSLTTNANLVGNVAGSAAMESLFGNYGSTPSTAFPLTTVPVATWPTPRDWGTAAYGYNFGYATAAWDSGPVSSPGNAISTLFWHGDWNDIDKSIHWASGVTHTLPASFYLTSRPSWWPLNLPFPAIGPDVLTGPDASGHANLIPAQNCFQNMIGGTMGSAGSPYQFNAARCYSNPMSTVLENLTFRQVTVK